MSMSTHVVGFAAAGDQWLKMQTIYYACIAANIKIPSEVDNFFGWTPPDPDGVRIDLTELDLCCRPWNDDGAEGYEIDIACIPKHVQKIRFYNSW